MKTRAAKILVVLGVVALLAAACGSDSNDSSGSGDTQGTTTTTIDEAGSDGTMADMGTDETASDGEMTGMEMNMGDPDATPAYEVHGADLVNSAFELLDTRPEGYDDVVGEAYLARHDDGTTVTIELTGLLPDVEYIAHVHDGSCEENGGDHYKFDPEGGDLPPNEIHLAFVSDGDGHGFMTAENDMVAGEDARSIVIHPVDLLDNKIACAPLQ